MYIKRDDIKPFDHKIYLASPTMHGEELEYMKKAYETNWMSTVAKRVTHAKLLHNRVLHFEVDFEW